MTYAYKKGKWVVCKDGVYYALTKAQVVELQALLADIQREEQCDGSNEQS